MPRSAARRLPWNSPRRAPSSSYSVKFPVDHCPGADYNAAHEIETGAGHQLRGPDVDLLLSRTP